MKPINFKSQKRLHFQSQTWGDFMTYFCEGVPRTASVIDSRWRELAPGNWSHFMRPLGVSNLQLKIEKKIARPTSLPKLRASWPEPFQAISSRPLCLHDVIPIKCLHLLRPKTDQVPQCLVRSPNCNSFSKRCCLQFTCTSSEKKTYKYCHLRLKTDFSFLPAKSAPFGQTSESTYFKKEVVWLVSLIYW